MTGRPILLKRGIDLVQEERDSPPLMMILIDQEFLRLGDRMAEGPDDERGDVRRDGVPLLTSTGEPSYCLRTLPARTSAH